MSGTYVALKYNKTSCDKIRRIIELYDIPNPTDDFHTTIIYSRVKGDVKLYEGKIMTWMDKLHYFDIQDGKRACVALLSKDVDVIFSEHKRLMRESPKLTYDYPEYIPHITLSYDVPKDFNVQHILPHNLFLIGEEALKDC